MRTLTDVAVALELICTSRIGRHNKKLLSWMERKVVRRQGENHLGRILEDVPCENVHRASEYERNEF